MKQSQTSTLATRHNLRQLWLRQKRLNYRTTKLQSRCRLTTNQWFRSRGWQKSLRPRLYGDESNSLESRCVGSVAADARYPTDSRPGEWSRGWRCAAEGCDIRDRWWGLWWAGGGWGPEAPGDEMYCEEEAAAKEPLAHGCGMPR